MLLIKKKVKGYIKNLTENKVTGIDTIAIKNKNDINFMHEDTKYKIIVNNNNKIILIRKSKEFTHEMIFEKNKTHLTIYFLNDTSIEIEFNILATDIINDNNRIHIKYDIIETKSKYELLIEMSDKI